MATSRHLFVRDLLVELECPGSYYNALALIAQCQAEGSHARFNPLATTLNAAGATDFNSVHVKHYVSLAQGVRATADTLRQTNMMLLLAALKSGTSSAAYWNALAVSPWGTRPPSGLSVPTFLDDVRRHWYARCMSPIVGT